MFRKKTLRRLRRLRRLRLRMAIKGTWTKFVRYDWRIYRNKQQFGSRNCRIISWSVLVISKFIKNSPDSLKNRDCLESMLQLKSIASESCKFLSDYFMFFDEKLTIFDNFLYLCSDIMTKNSLQFSYGRTRKITRWNRR